MCIMYIVYRCDQGKSLRVSDGGLLVLAALEGLVAALPLELDAGGMAAGGGALRGVVRVGGGLRLRGDL